MLGTCTCGTLAPITILFVCNYAPVTLKSSSPSQKIFKCRSSAYGKLGDSRCPHGQSTTMHDHLHRCLSRPSLSTCFQVSLSQHGRGGLMQSTVDRLWRGMDLWFLRLSKSRRKEIVFCTSSLSSRTLAGTHGQHASRWTYASTSQCTLLVLSNAALPVSYLIAYD